MGHQQGRTVRLQGPVLRKQVGCSARTGVASQGARIGKGGQLESAGPGLLWIVSSSPGNCEITPEDPSITLKLPRPLLLII